MRKRRPGTRTDPVQEFDSFDHFLSSGGVPSGRFTIPNEHVPVDFLYTPVEGAKTTVIFFHGATTGHVNLPWHPGKRVMEGIRANRLAISDPSLALDDSYSLTLAWHVGSSSQPRLQYFIENVIQRIQQVTGIEHLMFVGGSGGGFASLEMSRRFPRSVAVAMNPQTSISRYNKGAVKRYLNLSWDGANSLDEISKHATHDLVAAYPTVLNNTVAYIQNTRDSAHIQNHQIPFIEKVGDSPKLLMLMDAWGDPTGTGHVTPPHSVVRNIVRHLVAANGNWRKALVGRGFNHLTSVRTIDRAILKAKEKAQQPV